MRDLRIAHVGPNVAGLPWRLAEGQRALGHDVAVVTRPPNPYGFLSDIEVSPFKPRALCETLRFLRRWDADVVHLHGGMWWMDALHKLAYPEVFAVHYHGSETRRDGGLKWRSLPDVAFYTPPDLRRWHPGGTWVPQPIDTGAAGRVRTGRIEGHDPIFAHFPTGDKGTGGIIDMFVRAFGGRQVDGGRQDLIVRGEGATLWVFYGIPHREVIDIMAKTADVIIDQHTPLGIYGYVGAEAMALGKPVLATIDRSLYPVDCPVVRPSALKLMELANDAGYRRWLGGRGREYAARVHDARRVAERTITAYEAHL